MIGDGATINFSFRLVPRMFHTRPGETWFGGTYVKNRTWAALEFSIEDVRTDVERDFWTVIFFEVFLGVLTLGISVIIVEGMLSAAEASFSGKVETAKGPAPAARIRRTIPPPGGIGVRIALDEFTILERRGVFVDISVQPAPSPAVLFGPTTVPATYVQDELRYILRPPSGVSENDAALRMRWILVDRTNQVVLQDSDGPAAGRLQFEFTPGAAKDFAVEARLYRQLGKEVTYLATESVDLHVREALPPGAYIFWRMIAKTPQISYDAKAGAWVHSGYRGPSRHSVWHRTDAPCRAVNAPNRFRHDFEEADRLPFPLRFLEDQRQNMCTYCFYGGPGHTNPHL